MACQVNAGVSRRKNCPSSVFGLCSHHILEGPKTSLLKMGLPFRRLQGSAKAAVPESVTLQAMTAGKSRLEAARWFFEALVLQTKDFVDLQQVRRFRYRNCQFACVSAYRLSGAPIVVLSLQERGTLETQSMHHLVCTEWLALRTQAGAAYWLSVLPWCAQEAPYEDIVIVPCARLMAGSSQSRGLSGDR